MRSNKFLGLVAQQALQRHVGKRGRRKDGEEQERSFSPEVRGSFMWINYNEREVWNHLGLEGGKQCLGSFHGQKALVDNVPSVDEVVTGQSFEAARTARTATGRLALSISRELVELGLEGSDLPVLSIRNSIVSAGGEPPLHILLEAMETPTGLAVHALFSKPVAPV